PAPVASAEAAGADTSDASSPSSPAGARFAVQLGSFKDDATARSWATKLKSAGVPAYVERRKQADGSTATLLRAGPFADRAAASAAIAKVREAGLTQ
ncbi:TPA: SPOR domain-containing protein, partial [Burkholderia multivorans]